MFRAAQRATAVRVVGLVAVRARTLLSDDAESTVTIKRATAMIVSVHVRAMETTLAAGNATGRSTATLTVGEFAVGRADSPITCRLGGEDWMQALSGVASRAIEERTEGR